MMMFQMKFQQNVFREDYMLYKTNNGMYTRKQEIQHYIFLQSMIVISHYKIMETIEEITQYGKQDDN